MNTTYKFLAQIGGGIGPDVWDKFLDIDADDITDALNQAKGRADDLGATVFSVEQNDFPRDIEKSYFALQQELAALRAQRDALYGALQRIAGDCPCDNDGRGCPCEDVAREALALTERSQP